MFADDLARRHSKLYRVLDRVCLTFMCFALSLGFYSIIALLVLIVGGIIGGNDDFITGWQYWLVIPFVGGVLFFSAAYACLEIMLKIEERHASVISVMQVFDKSLGE